MLRIERHRVVCTRDRLSQFGIVRMRKPCALNAIETRAKSSDLRAFARIACRAVNPRIGKIAFYDRQIGQILILQCIPHIVERSADDFSLRKARVQPFVIAFYDFRGLRAGIVVGIHQRHPRIKPPVLRREKPRAVARIVHRQHALAGRRFPPEYFRKRRRHCKFIAAEMQQPNACIREHFREKPAVTGHICHFCGAFERQMIPF